MINRVDNTPYLTGTYSRNGNRTKKVDEEMPAFLLDHDGEGVVWERSDAENTGRKNKKPETGKNKASADSYESEVLTNKTETANDDEKVNDKEEQAYPFSELFKKAGEFFKGLFDNIMKVIWYGNDEEDVAKANAEASGSKGEAALNASEMVKDAAKEKRKKDRFVMPELKGKPARSTSVLTYYDKHGKLVKGTSDLGSEYKR